MPCAARSVVWRPWHVFTGGLRGSACIQSRERPRPHAHRVLFPGGRGTPFSGAGRNPKPALDTASDVSGWWLHDLRRTLATGLQRLGVRLEVTEAVLNHLSGSRAGVVGIYQRHDWAEEKRAALDAWSAHFSRGGRQAACRKGVAIQPSGLRRDVAEAVASSGIVRTAHQRPRGGQQRVPHLLQQCAGALDLGVAPRPQLHVQP